MLIEKFWSKILLLVSYIVKHYPWSKARYQMSKFPMSIKYTEYFHLSVGNYKKVVLILLLRQIESCIVRIETPALFALILYPLIFHYILNIWCLYKMPVRYCLCWQFALVFPCEQHSFIIEEYNLVLFFDEVLGVCLHRTSSGRCPDRCTRRLSQRFPPANYLARHLHHPRWNNCFS